MVKSSVISSQSSAITCHLRRVVRPGEGRHLGQAARRQRVGGGERPHGEGPLGAAPLAWNLVDARLDVRRDALACANPRAAHGRDDGTPQCGLWLRSEANALHAPAHAQ
eukprot:2739255-Prymnesium_polylepis.2